MVGTSPAIARSDDRASARPSGHAAAGGRTRVRRMTTRHGFVAAPATRL